jgi:hypothetical protein
MPVITRSIVQMITVGVFKKIKKSIRHYTHFDGNSYVLLDSEIDIQSDFTYSCIGTFSSAGFHLFADSIGVYRLAVTSSRGIYLDRFTNLATIPTTQWNILTNGLKHTLEISRIAGNLFCKIDGVNVELTAKTIFTDALGADSLCREYNTTTGIPRFVGYNYNAKITTGGITYTWPLNEPFETSIAYASSGGINGTYIKRNADNVTTQEPV